jgi:hypothetical protein
MTPLGEGLQEDLAVGLRWAAIDNKGFGGVSGEIFPLSYRERYQWLEGENGLRIF